MNIEPGRVVRAGLSSHSRRVTINAAIFAVSLFVYSAPAAGALVITPTFDSSITSDANAAGIEGAINAAIESIVTQVSSPNNLAATIYFGEMATGLGESLSGFYIPSYYNYYNSLASVMTTPAQLTALNSLGSAPGANTGNPVNQGGVFITSAEARNIGRPDPGFVTPANFNNAAHTNFTGTGTYDTVIGLNTSLTFPPEANNGDYYALQSVAMHEIDEALGIGGAGSTLGGSNQSSYVGDLDLYRYSAPGTRSFDTTQTTSPYSYFSIDGGNTVLSYFNQTSGADYADWLSNPIPNGFNPQVQDAYGTPGTDLALGTNELTAFSAIGYELTAQNPVVSEPTSLILFSVGLVGMTVFGRCRRTRFF